MELICLGSSSNGNCYILHSKDSDLIIECGVPFSEIKKGLNWSIKNVAGCIVSHEHKDHSKSVTDLLRYGVRVFALADVFNAHKVISSSFCTTIKPGQWYAVGDYKVLPLKVEHDVPCLGFIIEHPEMGRLLFVTDTMMFPYSIKGLNHVMLEVNYCDDVLQDNIDSGLMPKSMRPRLLGSHMELKTALNILGETDLSVVNEIVIIHLSSRNSDERDVENNVMGATGLPVYVAKPGLRVNLNKMPC